MKLDVRPLLAGEKLLPFDYEVEMEHETSDPHSFLYGVRFPSPMKVKGEITNTAGYMRMVLDLSVDYEAACARCLAPVSGRFTLALQKTVATRDMVRDLDEDKIDDFAIVEDGFLDMDETLLEQMEIEFPVRFLCKDDCKGLCPRCGKNLNERKCDCPEKDLDPRLAPLAKLLEQMKAEEKNENN